MEPRSSTRPRSSTPTPRKGSTPRAGRTIEGDPFPHDPRPRIVSVRASEDARTQAGSADANLPAGFLWVGHPRVHGVFLHFDLSGFAADAEIHSAELRLTFTGTYEGSNDVEVGAAKGPWDASTLTWNTQPSVAWKGETQTVSEAGEVSWNVLPAVRAWISGSKPNHGLALRGLGTVLKAVHSLETGGDDDTPRLVVAFTGSGGPQVPTGQ